MMAKRNIPTGRQRELLQLIADGLSVQAAAAKMGIQYQTAREMLSISKSNSEGHPKGSQSVYDLIRELSQEEYVNKTAAVKHAIERGWIRLKKE